ncbi:MAG: cupin domain-containing protein [Thainema sp.]
MSLTKHIQISALHCIEPAQGIEICPVDQALGITEYQMPSSHETNLVYIAPSVIEDLFVHHFQTDQLLVVKGHVVLAVLQNGAYQYILMRDRNPQVIKIPPGIPHGAIHLGTEPCVAINSVIRHGPPYARDYRPVPQRLPYDLEKVRSLFAEVETTSI